MEIIIENIANNTMITLASIWVGFWTLSFQVLLISKGYLKLLGKLNFLAFNLFCIIIWASSFSFILFTIPANLTLDIYLFRYGIAGVEIIMLFNIKKYLNKIDK